jgi:site-specific recombinase XerD
MELFFAENALANRRPFILSNEMEWVPEINHFLHSISVESGKTASIHTSRAYGYHLLDWLKYAEAFQFDWKRASPRQLIHYRNELTNHVSSLTKRPLKRETINLRLGMICNLYKFLVKYNYISRLPFDLEQVFVRRPFEADEMAHLRGFRRSNSNPLMFRTHERSIEIPSNPDVRKFIRGFHSWRNRLLAEVMWLTGLRRSEACALTVLIIPENLNSIETDYRVVRIRGKGAKNRQVKFPLRLLRSIDLYVNTERRMLLKSSGSKTDCIWVSHKGLPIKPAAINKAFEANHKRTGIRINPHSLRHSYAVNRLRYLQERNVKSALKILQGELGHSSLQTTQIYLHETDLMRAEAVAEHSGFIESLTNDSNGTFEN